MSKIATLITSLILGTSTLASAAPSLSFSASASWSSNSDAPLVRDHRFPTIDRARPERARWSWIALSQPLNAGRRNVLHVDERTDVLSALRLQIASGTAYIYNLEIRYDDGSTQMITVNRWLWSSAPTMELALAKRAAVDSIRIKSWGGREGGSVFQVFGQARMRELPPVVQPPVQPPVYQPPVQPPVYSGYTVGRDFTFANTLGYRYIAVGADKGKFGTLRLQATSGSIRITYVEVHFENGSAQVLQPHRTINAGMAYDFQLDGHGTNAVTRVVLKTNDEGTAVTDPSTFNLVLL